MGKVLGIIWLFVHSSIMKIREHGIQTRERLRFFKLRPRCDSDGKSFGSVRLMDCYAALLILVYGYLAAFIMFCLEKSVEFKQQKMHDF